MIRENIGRRVQNKTKKDVREQIRRTGLVEHHIYIEFDIVRR